MKTIEERFDDKWEPIPWTGCFVWTAASNELGYGRFNCNGRLQYAHRYAYARANGEISKDAFICHRCDNPACVNPSHLFLGDAAINCADKVSKGRHARGLMMSHTKLSDEQVSQILADGRKQSEIAEHYGVSQSYVSTLKKRGHRSGVGAEVVIRARHAWKLSDSDRSAIRSDDRPQKLIAHQYGVTQSVISRIKNNVVRRR